MKYRYLITALLLLSLAASCGREEEFAEPDTFSFVVYPGSRYLGQLSDLTKRAHTILKPGEEAPPVAIYDTDASVDEVAKFYARSYGYADIAPDATNNLSAAKPPAYYRTGDLQADAQAAAPLLEKLQVSPDLSKAQGNYRAADIAPRPNRPRVTVQRPYFDMMSSQVVDRTLILMSR